MARYVHLTDLQCKMLLEAAKSFRQADKGCLNMSPDATAYGGRKIKIAMREWPIIIKKLKGK